MPKDKNRPHPTTDDLRHRFEDLAARFGEKSRPASGAPASPPPADDYGKIWASLQDLFTRDVTAREFRTGGPGDRGPFAYYARDRL